jgi:hypothetical protein
MPASANRTRLVVAFCALFCLFFIGRLAFLLLLGEGVPSDDSLLNAILIGKMLDGDYDWPRLFRDAYTNGHFNFVPILAQYGWAWATDWNFRLALFAGAGLALIKVFLLHSALARPKDRLLSCLLWPFLFALTFATTSMDVFQLDSSSFQLGLNQLGLIFGIWALARFPGEWKGVLGAWLGAWLATWSWGSGAVAWPVFLLGMVFLGYRKSWQYLALITGASIVLLPYFILLTVAPISGQEPKLLTLFNVELVVQSTGLLFAQGYRPDMAMWRGLAGFVFALSGIFLCLRARIDLRRFAVPSMLLLYVLFHFYQVSLFRSRLMPWYAYQASLFWIGLLGLAYQLLLEKRNQWWAYCLAAVLLYFYLSSNMTWQDKIASLRHQGPASVACLRDYATAPKDCESLLFRWKPYEDFHQMARALDRHHLSLFSKPPEISLQGDRSMAPTLHWIHAGRVADWRDFRRLDLEIRPGETVEWKVAWPSGFRKAELRYEYWTSDRGWTQYRSDLKASADAEAILAPGLYRYPSILFEK